MQAVPIGAEPETRPRAWPSECNIWVTAVLAGTLVISTHGGLGAQSTRSTIEDVQQLAEYLDRADSHITEMTNRGEIRPDPLLAVIIDDPVEFREDPPHGLLNLFIGSVVGSLQPGTVFDIREEKIVPTLGGGEVWYSIKVLYSPNEGERTHHAEGWINAGVSGFSGLMVAGKAR